MVTKQWRRRVTGFNRCVSISGRIGLYRPSTQSLQNWR